MSALRPIQDLAERGMQPAGRMIWLGFGFRPPKRSAIAIDPSALPTDADCTALAALDVILCINGYLTSYGALRQLCGSIHAARPRRLQVVDLDYRRTAFLVLGGRQ